VKQNSLSICSKKKKSHSLCTRIKLK